MTSKKGWKERYYNCLADFNSVEPQLIEARRHARAEVNRAEHIERAVAWFRHQLNQAIETTETGHTVPPGTLGEGQARIAQLRARRDTYAQVLGMLAAPVPPHFNPATVNVYAERSTVARTEE